MNTNTTGRRRRYSARAAAIATFAAVAFGAVACGTETASDGGTPAAPAPAPKAERSHPPVSPDTAERRYADRHYAKAPSGREIYIP
ncbi:MAG TPA: hypothetical protein VFV89_15725 [Nocardioides sp.]|uniref:hypothetical protein n=1 Tax=Nocardioides sp. TaxID=35761 RepID=UPI002E3086A4|nr:hypothetical protein [Nocardioides sp.]HEX5089258.1 hypothetical protein [Nocardioides sp.]